MHGQQPATPHSRKTLNAFFSKQCSQNRWNLYLQKLLADSTETFFILKNICTSGWGGRNQTKLQKKLKFVIFKGVEGTKNIGKKLVQTSSAVIF